MKLFENSFCKPGGHLCEKKVVATAGADVAEAKST